MNIHKCHRYTTILNTQYINIVNSLQRVLEDHVLLCVPVVQPDLLHLEIQILLLIHLLHGHQPCPVDRRGQQILDHQQVPYRPKMRLNTLIHNLSYVYTFT